MEIDLVLSGTGTRFPVFIGAIEALEKQNIEVKRVAGTSGGALVACGMASGLSADQMKKLLLDTDLSKFKDFSLFSLFIHYGLYAGNVVEKFVEKMTGGKTFADLDMDCQIIATDIFRGQSLIFNKKETPNVKLSTAARYSISIPMFFGLEKYADTYLVDGVVSSNYALDIFDDNERPTIGLRSGSRILTKVDKVKSFPFNFFQYISLCIETLILAIEREHIEDAYWAKSIHLDVTKYGVLQFDLTKEDKLDMFKIGYDAVMEKLMEKL